MYTKIFAASSLFAAAHAQLAGSLTSEVHPSMSWQRCTGKNQCSNVNGKITIDANWRWLHDKNGPKNCYTGNTWDDSLCSNNAACTANCALDGADYSGTYGITAGGNSLKLQFVTNGPYSKNIGSRTYLMENDSKYQMFNLLNQEFTFDVDLSQLPCGLNGALYFVSMDADGGMAKYPSNKAGAKYGTGYCDAQCPRDLKYINGQANREGWQGSSNDANAGVGAYGSCCAEMDVWEANSISTAVTPHSADPIGQTRCTGDKCGGTYSNDRYGGWTDPDGCDFNSYRMGDKDFYGPGKKVDTKRKFTVVTQFVGNPLTEIRRFYVQDGKTIPNSVSKIPGVSGNSITTNFCLAQKKAFTDVDPFTKHGGMNNMGQALGKGMVLVMSLWDDHYSNMLWLDSTYPTTSTKLGSARGTCATSSGNPAEIENSIPNSSVTFSNIKFGPLGSTFNQ